MLFLIVLSEEHRARVSAKLIVILLLCLLDTAHVSRNITLMKLTGNQMMRIWLDPVSLHWYRLSFDAPNYLWPVAIFSWNFHLDAASYHPSVLYNRCVIFAILIVPYTDYYLFHIMLMLCFYNIFRAVFLVKLYAYWDLIISITASTVVLGPHIAISFMMCVFSHLGPSIILHLFSQLQQYLPDPILL